MMSAYMRVLRGNPDFSRLWSAQVISLLGDWFNTIALSALVVAYSPGSEGIAVSLLLLSRFVPPMIVSPFAGVLVDRMNRKWLLIWSNLLRAVVVLCFLPIVGNPDLIWLIYALTVLQFILSAVFEPGQSALIPTLVQRGDLVEANTLVSVTWSVMLALGAIIGGAVATVFGTSTALLIDALTFLVAAFLIWRISGYIYTPRIKPARKEDDKTGLIEGLRFLRQNPAIASNLMVKSGNSIGNVDALMTIFATQIFVIGDGGQFSLGIMYSAFGIGAILGPLLANRRTDGTLPSMRRFILLGFVLAVAGWIVMGVAGSIVVLCLGLVARAMGGSINWTYSTVIIQKSTPDEYLGRVFSIDMQGFYLATVISTIAHGTIIDLVGTQNANWVALGTTAVAIVPLIAWWWVMGWLESHGLKTAEEVQEYAHEHMPDAPMETSTGVD